MSKRFATIRSTYLSEIFLIKVGMVSTKNVIEFYFYKESKSKNKFFFCFGGGGGGGIDGRTDKQAQTNSPLQLLRSWGHNNA